VLRSDSAWIHSPYLVNEEPYFGCSHTTPLALEVPITPFAEQIHVLYSQQRILDAPLVDDSSYSLSLSLSTPGCSIPSPNDRDSKNAATLRVTVVHEKVRAVQQTEDTPQSVPSGSSVARDRYMRSSELGSLRSPGCHRWRACLRSLLLLSVYKKHICVAGSWVIVKQKMRPIVPSPLALRLYFGSDIDFVRLDFDQVVQTRAWLLRTRRCEGVQTREQVEDPHRFKTDLEIQDE
jgi:hypothetical protein